MQLMYHCHTDRGQNIKKARYCHCTGIRLVGKKLCKDILSLHLSKLLRIRHMHRLQQFEERKCHKITNKQLNYFIKSVCPHKMHSQMPKLFQLLVKNTKQSVTKRNFKDVSHDDSSLTCALIRNPKKHQLPAKILGIQESSTQSRDLAVGTGCFIFKLIFIQCVWCCCLKVILTPICHT